MSGASIEFVAVSKWYGQVSALTDLSCRLEAGVTGLVGQNGVGKSTMLKLTSGLLRPSQGEVLVCGRSPRHAEARRQLGFCPDLDRFYEAMTGRRFVAWMLRLHGVGGGRAYRRAGELLDQLGLGEAMHRRIGGYSKGMRQRVKLAQALAHEPKVLLLDEPLTGLDPLARHEMGVLIRELGSGGTAVLVSSHVLHELQSVAGRFLLVHQGRLLAEGTVDELREQLADRPRKLYVRSRRPRQLAQRLAALDTVIGLQVQEEGVLLDTRGGGELYQSMTAIGADGGDLIDELTPVDDNLEAVFGYLVA